MCKDIESLFKGYDKIDYNKGYSETTTTYTYDWGDGIIIVRNVPCLEDVWGRTFFTDEVKETLDDLVRRVKELNPELSVLYYRNGGDR